MPLWIVSDIHHRRDAQWELEKRYETFPWEFTDTRSSIHRPLGSAEPRTNPRAEREPDHHPTLLMQCSGILSCTTLPSRGGQKEVHLPECIGLSNSLGGWVAVFLSPLRKARMGDITFMTKGHQVWRRTAGSWAPFWQQGLASAHS